MATVTATRVIAMEMRCLPRRVGILTMRTGMRRTAMTMKMGMTTDTKVKGICC
ncbi:MAG: hypothetical protein SPF15_00255 [Candidatus Cryptobacteroides sp.]|uniref:hypothetical protein n=1 Tax=Candidatus Cryptobacteroides sp. TaxID=2952915 RepID=UPI002A7EE61B|nr:hypothetical protein [Candidatus Cryptobacteroides sp.]MDY5042425.1 hypothetical protein [Candidatus Cryptobacteroides sp.]